MAEVPLAFQDLGCTLRLSLGGTEYIEMHNSGSSGELPLQALADDAVRVIRAAASHMNSFDSWREPINSTIDALEATIDTLLKTP